MQTEPVTPHCPKCKGKPTSGQLKLSESERDKLRGAPWQAIAARFEAAYVCRLCRAIYLHQDGFSSFVARLRDSA